MTVIRPLSIAATLALAGPACLPAPEAPSPRGAFEPAPIVRPPPVDPEPEPDAPAPGPWDPPPPATPARPPSPIPGGGPHPLDPRPLPPPWPTDDLAVGPVDAVRRVITDEDIVGFAFFGETIHAASATGGVFRADPIGGWRPEPTPLPPLRWFAGIGSALVACPADGDRAQISYDGRRWHLLDAPCGAGGRRTLARDGVTTWALTPDRAVLEGELTGDRIAHPLPSDATMLTAGHGLVLALAADRGARADLDATDGRPAFHPISRTGAVVDPRDGLVTDKGRVIIVGRAAPGRVGIEVSPDRGRTWAVADAPERLAGDLARVDIDARGVLYATPADDGPPLRSLDGGARWSPIGRRLARGAVLAVGHGAIAATPRGVAIGLDRPAPRPPGLDRPLWRVVYTHPRVAVAVGTLGGLWRSVDGGVRWTLAPGTGSLPFTDLDRVGGHAVAAVGEDLARASDDAGARWRLVTSAPRCAARWVRFNGDDGLLGCADGRAAHSSNGGESWVAGDAPAPAGPPIWLDSTTGVVLTPAGELAWTTDGGERYTRLPPPRPFIELAPAPGGVSALGTDGSLWQTRGPHAAWSATAPLDTLDGPPRAHRLLLDGRAAVVTDRALYLASPPIAGHRTARRLGPAPGARAVVPSGDGALLVLQETATTRFEPR